MIVKAVVNAVAMKCSSTIEVRFMETAEKPAWTRIPYDIYTDPAIYEREQERIFCGPTWNYVALAAEVAEPGDFKVTEIGDKPVVVVRDRNGTINVVENRCAHRGVQFCRQPHGSAKAFQCPYHLWTYDLAGNLTGVPLRKGIEGKGGYPADFDPAQHGLRRLRVAEHNGVVFASFSDQVEPLDEYLGPMTIGYLDRVFDGRRLEVLGYQRQRIDCNWKLMIENIRDSYHAGLLHVFLVTFGLFRLDQPAKAYVDPSGRHCAMTGARREGERATGAMEEVSTYRPGFELEGLELLKPVREFPGEETLVMQPIWPNVIVQRQSNTLAMRQLITRGPLAFELHWTFFGYADDTPELRAKRLRQANLMGPAGFVSIDDTEVIELAQRGIAPYPRAEGFLGLDGTDTDSRDYGVTETTVRAFHKLYREVMGL
jgi:salicylate 5-hydroxylase large subunit